MKLRTVLLTIAGYAATLIPAFGTVAAEPDSLHYSNPVLRQAAADPTVMRATDGYYYLMSTESIRNTPIYKSSDLVNWQFLGTAFTDYTRPTFIDRGRIWAPDINYVNGKYVLYYAVGSWGGGDSFSTQAVEWDGCGVGVAVADSITGPYENLGKLFISSDIDVQSSIDQCYVEDVDGSKWLFWGSYHGIYAIPLSDDGLSVKEGAVKQRVSGTLTEGTMLYRRGKYFYMIGSTGSCCNGLNATYHLVVSRSENLLGPYVDKNGLPALENHFSELIHRDDCVVGTGHCSEIVEDDAGQTWLLYHGYQIEDWKVGRVVYMTQIQWDSEDWPYAVGGRPSVTWDRPLIGGTEYTYRDAQYIEFTGVPARSDSKYRMPHLFDTGYVPGKDTRIEVRCRSYAYDSQDGEEPEWSAVVSGGTSKTDGLSLYLNRDGAYWAVYAAGYVNENIASQEGGADYDITLTRHEVTVNGQSCPVDDSAYSGTTARVTLFSGFQGRPYVGRIYSLKIYEGDTLVRDYAPCVRNEDGMPMFHDAVTGSYIRPSDAEGFAAGGLD